MNLFSTPHSLFFFSFIFLFFVLTPFFPSKFFWVVTSSHWTHSTSLLLQSMFLMIYIYIYIKFIYLLPFCFQLIFIVFNIFCVTAYFSYHSHFTATYVYMHVTSWIISILWTFGLIVILIWYFHNLFPLSYNTWMQLSYLFFVSNYISCNLLNFFFVYVTLNL